MKTWQLIDALGRGDDGDDVMKAIDALRYSERIRVRQIVGEVYGTDVPLPRNLYYDYAVQVWIDENAAKRR